METVILKSATIRQFGKEDATKEQLRGSTPLLIGRLLSLGIGFAAQMLMIRYLSKSDF